MSVYGDITPRVGIYAHEQMLSHAEPIIVLQKMGLVKPVPKHKGENVKFRRPNPWSVTTTPLTEGVTPAAKSIGYTDVSVVLAEYGDFVELTDKIQDLHEDPVLNDQMMLAGENAAETLEIVTYNVLKGGTSVKYGGGTSRVTVASKITLALVQESVRNLMGNRAKRITSILSPSTNIGTRAVEAAFVAFTHTDAASDIRALPGFTKVADYGSRQVLCPEELGTVEDVRFVCSPLFVSFANAGVAIGATGLKSTGGANIDVYPMIVVAKEAYGTTPLKGMSSSEIKVLRPGEARGGDPLGQRGSVGWKAWFQAVRLNEAWMRRIEVGVTAL
ncbi:N4-gp56 family major capsid protein [Methylibium sp.]|uniref:N4-gp56 family major capsid protein n=1 Tax=Methylibium sp. TaxID=2067992 RepID=UPI0025D92664|nr:N4-gp56 family major capsid protein [Methylibium sp.]